MFWLLTSAAPLFLLLQRPCSASSASNNDCGASESYFGACVPTRPPSCPNTCPQCRCVVDSCCFPTSSIQNNFQDRAGTAQQSSSFSSGDSNTLNTVLAMLLLLRQQPGNLGGNGGLGGGIGGGFGFGGLGQCQDRAWNCGQFAAICLSSPRMLSFCPVTCGLCPNPLLGQQLLLQTLLGQSGQLGGGIFGGGIGGNDFGIGTGTNLPGRIQDVLSQITGLAGSANTALGAIGGSGLNLQTIGQRLGLFGR